MTTADRGRHLASLLLVQVEDAAEHPGLALLEVAAGPRVGDQRLQVVGVVVLLIRLGSTPTAG